MSKNILVVDDSAFMRKRIISKITKIGHSVIAQARDGNEAIKLYEEHKPDLVLMDITMRGKDGLSASKEILEKDPSAKIIMLTMLNDDEYRTTAEKLGVSGFVLKDDLDKLENFI